jgi:competence protein ComEA
MEFDKEKKKALFISTGIFLVGVIITLYEAYFRPPDIEWQELPISNTAPIEKVPTTVMVQISGAVKHPGVYVLTEFSRIIDGLEEAGGVVFDADISALNLTVVLKDQMHITVPFKKINIETSEERFQPSTKININVASEKELTRLKGIGVKTAATIVNYRQQNGPFLSVESLKKVKGIGPKMLEKIKVNISL